jgi:hypothetical protein
VRSEVLTETSMQIAVFWVIALCSVVNVYRRFRGACCLWNVGKLLPDYMAQHPRRQPSAVNTLFSPHNYLVFFESKTVIQLTKKCTLLCNPKIHYRQLSLSWTRLIQSKSWHPVSYYYPPIYVYVFEVIAFLPMFWLKLCMHFYLCHVCCVFWLSHPI